MDEPITWVGVDISKSTLDVAIHGQSACYQYSNDCDGIAQLVTLLRSYPNPVAVMEATGGLEKQARCELATAGFSSALVNPRRVRALANAMGWAKTDPLDAKVLALFGATTQPTVTSVPPPATTTLSEWVNRRHQLVEMQVAEKNRRARASTAMKADIDEVIEQLQQRIERINQMIDQLSQANAIWQSKRAILVSTPGIGPVVSAVCLADLPELGQLSEKKIARLVGVAPINHDSGQHRGKRQIAGGRSDVRAALYMGTLATTRYNPMIRTFYQRLLAAGKLKKVALTACMHKLLTILNAMVRDMKPWQPPTPDMSTA